MFKTAFDSHPRVYQKPGSPVHVLYSSKVDEDGNIQLVESGVEDIYDSIQSHKDSCDIHVLLKRFANGEVDVLSRVQGAYGDFTSFPSTYAELLNSMIAGQAYFESLPVEVRAKFDHSFERFMASMDNMPEFLEKLGVSSAPDISSNDNDSAVGVSPVEPSREPINVKGEN